MPAHAAVVGRELRTSNNNNVGGSVGVGSSSYASLQGSRRKVATRKMLSSVGKVPPTAALRSNTGAGKVRYGEGRFVKLSDYNSVYGLPAEWLRLLPTTVVVPSLTPSAVTADMRNEVHGRTASSFPASKEVSAPLTPAATSTAFTTFSPASQPCTFREHFGTFSLCSPEEHQNMIQCGFVFCPQCGFRLNSCSAANYFLPTECPARHERSTDKAEKSDRFCVFCGISKKVSARPPIAERRNECGGDSGGDAVKPFCTPQLQPSAPRAVVADIPFATFQRHSAGGPVNVSTLAEEGKKDVAGKSDKKNDTGSGLLETVGNVPLLDVLSENQITEAPTPLLTKAGLKNTATGISLGCCTHNVVTSKAPEKFLSKKTVRPLDKTINTAFSLYGETQAEVSSCSSVESTSVPAAKDKGAMRKMAVTTKDMSYSAGVPGVSCGLPHCALCKEKLVDMLSHSAASTKRHLLGVETDGRCGDPLVIVLHNHYYHKM